MASITFLPAGTQLYDYEIADLVVGDRLGSSFILDTSGSAKLQSLKLQLQGDLIQ